MTAAMFQPETRDARMSRFDALPPAVRQSINAASFEFHPGMAERLLRRGATEQGCAARIAITDLGLMARKGGA
ncbi:hypothetical protein GGQ73_000607 [Rhizobium skierniewicense]|uniref:Uncharacterized protein n=1 Tax=Rhizobium skierniewicense TaxID=984260 RepID=A0A7W6C2Q1_9HYPH|nr:DUF6525 family protein [Rhizobium skierniewicense]MBB3944682.1 hypothetical protein [Rhizobium skierniewicense]